MTIPIVTTCNYVTLVGGGDLESTTLNDVLKIAPYLVAADGAADVALSFNAIPEAVIGDFDSLSADARETIPQDRFFHIAEQNSTDFEKCLSRIEAPLVLALGFMGARLDHELAVYSVLMRYPERRCIVVGECDICLHVPEGISLELAPGTRVSLFPLGQVTGKSTGLRWPIEGIEFAPNGRIGTSNEATQARVTLDFAGPGMLLILPRHCLGAVIAAIAPSQE
ncbi:thiamine diphosphokinase [Celeribacter arenosi]|uniref:Thiamine diphosphokinase n=1 Tax=Celeribacter arenosi TaxID=792649 RepID=A0ABP7K9J1_9RHOB